MAANLQSRFTNGRLHRGKWYVTRLYELPNQTQISYSLLYGIQGISGARVDKTAGT